MNKKYGYLPDRIKSHRIWGGSITVFRIYCQIFVSHEFSHIIHSFPVRTKNVNWLGENIIVNDSSVHWKHSHKQKTIPATKENVPNLKETGLQCYTVECELGLAVKYSYSLTSLSDFFACNGFSLRTIHRENRNMISPCPRSPNMTAKRKGNVMIAYGAANIRQR